MSVSRLLQSTFAALIELFQGIAGWLLVAPIAALVHRRKHWVAVIGREDGKFIDNTKYFFIDASTSASSGLRIVHVSERPQVVAAIRAAGLEAMHYPSPAAIWFLICAGTAVVDSIEWHRKWRRFLLSRAKLIQLWHGVGFKRIELDKWRNETFQKKAFGGKWLLWPRLVRWYVSGRITKYDAVVTTSTFYREHVFSIALPSRHLVVAGYPRNAFQTTHPLAWLNVDPVIQGNLPNWLKRGRKLVLIVPTFRDSRSTSLGLDAARVAQLDAFCAAHGFEFLFKFHPYEQEISKISGCHLHLLDSGSDIYPLLPHIYSIVTDYSSIYMDFLLLDRPVLFLTPDLQEYIAHDRDLQFDFQAMTPGPKCSDWSTLLPLLVEPEAEEWRKMRGDLKALAFDGMDQTKSTARILEFAVNQKWLPHSHQAYR